jgi:hypothetical protein
VHAQRAIGAGLAVAAAEQPTIRVARDLDLELLLAVGILDAGIQAVGTTV